MLAKITRGNQITIPKEIVREARLDEAHPYVDVSYKEGSIRLKPVVVEERLEPNQFEKFQAWALQKEKEDVAFPSLKEGAAHLAKRLKKS